MMIVVMMMMMNRLCGKGNMVGATQHEGGSEVTQVSAGGLTLTWWWGECGVHKFDPFLQFIQPNIIIHSNWPDSKTAPRQPNYFPTDDAEAGQARGTGGKDSKPFSQEIRVNFVLQLWIWTYIDQKAQLEVQCIDTKQTIEKLPPPFIYYRSELLNF